MSKDLWLISYFIICTYNTVYLYKNYNCLLHVCCYAIMHALLNYVVTSIDYYQEFIIYIESSLYTLWTLAIIQLHACLGPIIHGYSAYREYGRLYTSSWVANLWHEKMTCRVVYTKLHIVLLWAIKCAAIYKLLRNLSIHKLRSTIYKLRKFTNCT